MNKSELEEKLYLFKKEQDILCQQKLLMLRKMYKENPRPLRFYDYVVRGLKCQYTENDIIED